MIDLERLKELEQKATKGPFVNNPDNCGRCFDEVCGVYQNPESLIAGKTVAHFPVELEADRELFVELRNVLPEILSVLEAAEKMAEVMEDLVRTMNDDHWFAEDIKGALAAYRNVAKGGEVK